MCWGGEGTRQAKLVRPSCDGGRGASHVGGWGASGTWLGEAGRPPCAGGVASQSGEASRPSCA